MKTTTILVLLLPVLFISSCVLLKRSVNIDRSQPGYKSRIIDFWEGNAPGKKQGPFRYTDMKFVRSLMGNEYEEQAPYLLDYTLKDSVIHSCFIICPGGSYAFRSEKVEGIEIAEWLNSIGISAFVLNYRVEPYQHPIPLMDLSKAMQYLRAYAKKFHIDPNRLGVLGASAGGHLAATLATHYDPGNAQAIDLISLQSSRPDLAVLCYPLITLLPYEGQTEVEKRCIRKLVGENPADSLVNILSCEKQVTAQTPPAFIWTTRNDKMVNPVNASLYASALKEKGIEQILHLFAKGRHGLGLAKGKKGVGQWPVLCAQWLETRGFTRKNEQEKK